jgi:DNA-binding response OmpR family regulator
MSAVDARLPRTALAVFPTDAARAFACDVLRAAGIVSVAPASAIDPDDAAHVDLIVTDWPPHGDIGAHICALRAANGAGRKTPVVMLTARDGRADLEAARRAGADAYIVKPVSAALLKHRLCKIAGAPQPAFA